MKEEDSLMLVVVSWNGDLQLDRVSTTAKAIPTATSATTVATIAPTITFFFVDHLGSRERKKAMIEEQEWD